MFPSALSHCSRDLVGPLAIYAPRTAGNLTVWRGFPAQPWSPDIDLVVVTGTPAVLAALHDSVPTTTRAAAAQRGNRYLKGAHFLARRAGRGVRLSEILTRDASGRPPVDLLALVALALLRPGPRLANVVGPQQIVVSFEGDVHVDGLDPESQLRMWPSADDLEGGAPEIVDAALIAACAAGTESYTEARLLVDDAVASTSTSPVVELITRTAAGDREGALAVVDSLPADRELVADLVRGLFSDRAAACDETREDLAMLDCRVLPAWHQVIDPPLAPRAASFSALRAAAATEAALVAADVDAFGADCRATVDTYRAMLAKPIPRVMLPSFWSRTRSSISAWFATPQSAR
ncbi:MAG TPA: hypothetical protein VGO62_07320 [Myxococcota bacterium]|jgi:hypothetical protein